MAEIRQLGSDMGALHVVYQVGAQTKTFVADPETFHKIFPMMFCRIFDVSATPPNKLSRVHGDTAYVIAVKQLMLHNIACLKSIHARQ